MNRLKPIALAVACGFAGFGLVPPGDAFAQAAGARDGAVALREVDIRAFIEDVSNVTGRTFIVDPRVSGRVTVIATQSLSERELFDVFLSTLRVNGYVAIPTTSGAYRIVPDEVAARDPGAAGVRANDRYVTQVLSLRFADSESVANAIRPMLSARGQVTATRRGNSLVVVDYGSTVGRVREVVRELDQDMSTYRMVRLKNTSAAEMARVAQALVAGEAAGGGSSVQVVPVPSSNSVVLRGDEKTIARYAPLIEELDIGADFRSGVKVIPLTYAKAEEVVPVLQQISTSLGVAVADGGAANAARRANIAAHRGTNSLIISADPETQDALAEVVRSIDIRRQQILVEAIIVEVSDQAAQELGIQFLVSGNGTNAIPFLSTSYANTAPNLLALTGALLVREGSGSADSSALTQLRQAAVSSLINSNGALAGVGGQRSDGAILGLILNALKEDTKSNVLSTPSVMTLDNETASILVGQQIPVTTGETLSSNNDNPFRTVQRQDVGVKLEVTPQMSQGGAIRLQIRQEVSSVFGTVSSGSDDLITNNREIETVVQVDAGQVIVLGGLIQEDIQQSSAGIPGLKNIPIAGRLFRSDGTSRRRTNLMVFLRPTLVNTAEQAREATERQFDAVKGYRGIDPGILSRLNREYSVGEPPSKAGEAGPSTPGRSNGQ